MKRTIAVLLAAVMLMAVLCGCGSRVPEPVPVYAGWEEGIVSAGSPASGAEDLDAYYGEGFTEFIEEFREALAEDELYNGDVPAPRDPDSPANGGSTPTDGGGSGDGGYNNGGNGNNDGGSGNDNLTDEEDPEVVYWQLPCYPSAKDVDKEGYYVLHDGMFYFVGNDSWGTFALRGLSLAYSETTWNAHGSMQKLCIRPSLGDKLVYFSKYEMKSGCTISPMTQVGFSTRAYWNFRDGILSENVKAGGYYVLAENCPVVSNADISALSEQEFLNAAWELGYEPYLFSSYIYYTDAWGREHWSNTYCLKGDPASQQLPVGWWEGTAYKEETRPFDCTLYSVQYPENREVTQIPSREGYVEIDLSGLPAGEYCYKTDPDVWGQAWFAFGFTILNG